MLKRPTKRSASSIEARITEAIEQMRPLLRIEHCGIELLEYRHEEGMAVLRVEGDCPDCEMSAGMLLRGIEAHLRMRIPEIRQVREARDDAEGDADLEDEARTSG